MLKADHQKIFFELQQKSQDIDIIKVEKNCLDSQIEILKKNDVILQNELVVLKAENKSLTAQIETQKKNEKALQNQIAHLDRENKRLLAQNVQFRRSNNENIAPMQDEEKIIENSTGEQQYEVEKILRHKIRCGQKSFLIRWKGFGQEEDQWVSEKDLHCENILQTYLNSLK